MNMTELSSYLSSVESDSLNETPLVGDDYCVYKKKKFGELVDRRVSINVPVEADEQFVDQLDKAVQLDTKDFDIPPLTVPHFFLTAVKQFKDRAALVFEHDSLPQYVTYQGYYKAVLNASLSLLALGLQMNETVALACYNSAYHFICTMATMFAGGVYTDLYTFSKHSLVFSILDASKAGFVVVDDNRQLQEWEQFMQKGSAYPAAFLVTRLNQLAPNKCCAVFYMSNKIVGQTIPEGIMMSHDNLTFMAQVFSKEVSPKIYSVKENSSLMPYRTLSYLSLCWAFGLVTEMLLPIALGATVFFAGPDVLQGSLIKTLRMVRPSIFFATSRVWIMLYKRVTEKFSTMNMLMRFMLLRKLRAMMQDENVFKNRIQLKGRDNYLQNKLKKKLGMNQVKMFFSIERPLDVQKLMFYLSIGIPICEVLDSPLLSGPHAFNRLENFYLASQGKELFGCESRGIKRKEDCVRKLFVKGRHVCMGILEKNTILSQHGFINTGLLFERGLNGNIYIKGTTDNVIMLSNGCTIPCEPVEIVIKEILPIIASCILVGNDKPFLSLIITIKTIIDLKTLEPTPTLTIPTRVWLRKFGIDVKLSRDLLKSKFLFEIVDDAVSHVNKQLGDASIKTYKILPVDFSFLEGEIDPVTRVINRKVILDHYKKIVQTMYSSGPS
ncbi:long-chain-fatty-acid--CoA ligase ACSBG2-like isoform X2 [Physella acuta]|uniref:long-chain-fatty-acid--CoA ligase ACSBG2-like isoform X2 n=1 Tax=Physella acuta TaxID=109671 RepID=UPI0027DBB21E|nr:long-chain-fatty-acid--CoA ligase ACSBG2-like isoform X2 [Physella acuta]